MISMISVYSVSKNKEGRREEDIDNHPTGILDGDLAKRVHHHSHRLSIVFTGNRIAVEIGSFSINPIT
jgi:hypothetical protein